MLEAKGIPSDRASFPKTWVEMRKMSKEYTVWDGDTLKSAGFMPNRIPETMAIWSALNGGMLFTMRWEGSRWSSIWGMRRSCI